MGRFKTNHRYEVGDLVIRFASQGSEQAWPVFIQGQGPQNRTASKFLDQPCPWGSPGEIVICREPWAASTPNTITFEAGGELIYTSKIKAHKLLTEAYKTQPPDAWRSAASMPDELARSYMEVKDIRCEKLWSLEEAEAAEAHGLRNMTLRQPPSGHQRPYRQLFAQQWDARIRPAEERWRANPWVWVLELIIPTATKGETK